MRLQFKDVELTGMRWTGSNLKEIQDFLRPGEVGFSDGFLVIDNLKMPEDVVLVKLPSGNFTTLHHKFVEEVCKNQTVDDIFKDNSIRFEKMGDDGYLFSQSVSINYLRKVLREGGIDKCTLEVTTDKIILKIR